MNCHQIFLHQTRKIGKVLHFVLLKNISIVFASFCWTIIERKQKTQTLFSPVFRIRDILVGTDPDTWFRALDYGSGSRSYSFRE